MDSFKEFSTRESLDAWISANYDYEYINLMKNVYKDFSFPLGDYKGMSFKKYNEVARTGCGSEADKQSVRKIQNFITQYKIPKSIKVYRFVDIKELLLLYTNTIFNRIYTYPQFLSTTLTTEFFGIPTIKDGRFVISIIVPIGTNGIYFPEINPKRPEYEILLPHHTKLKRIGHMEFQIAND